MLQVQWFGLCWGQAEAGLGSWPLWRCACSTIPAVRWGLWLKSPAKQAQVLTSPAPLLCQCKKLLRPGEYGVFAARAGEQCCWHRLCFACQTCGQALINLIYFYHDGHLYCGRHHAELLRPRCPACDQVEQRGDTRGIFPRASSVGTGNALLGYRFF